MSNLPTRAENLGSVEEMRNQVEYLSAWTVAKQ